MGRVGSDGEDEHHSSSAVRKRFKFPKKFFDNSNGVDHASVPRKLRSAIKKRNRDPVSPPQPVSKKLNQMSNGAETLRKDVKRSKLSKTRGSSRSVNELLGPLTKDEEEVAEALYALAGMVPDVGTMSVSKSNNQLSDVKSLALTEPESSVIESGVMEERQEIRTASPQFIGEASKQFLNASVSAGEAAKSKSFEDALRCDTSISTKFPAELDRNHHGTPLGSGMRKPSNLEGIPAGEEQLEISLQPVAATGYQAKQQNTLKEKRNNGSLLSSCLSAVGSSCSDILGPSSQLATGKFPAWFGNTGSDAQAQNTKSCLPTAKDSKVSLDFKKSWKSCTAHVYISQLIKNLQSTAREEDTLSLNPSQDGYKQGAHINQNSLTGKVNDVHGIVSTGNTASSATEKNPTEVQNAILLHKRLQSQQQASTASGFNSLLKQNLDFMSLPAGSYVVRGTNDATIAGHDHEGRIMSHNHPSLHFLRPQNCYSSTAFHCHPSTEALQQVLLPPYLGGASTRPSLEAAMASPIRPLQHNEIPNMSAHFTPHYRFGGVAASQMRDWQNAAQNTHLFQPSQAQFATSSSMEAFSSKYAPTSLNEQNLISIATARSRGQYNNFPSGLEGNGHGLYPNSAPSLQLLCHDRR